MKKLSKFFAVLLVVSMICSSMAFAAEFSDVKSDNKYYEPIKILSAFGIINGYEDGTFGPDKDVTRAEFSKMLMGAMASAGIGDPDPLGMPFTDMHDPTVAWSVGDIRTAYDLGIINGMTETTFEPKSNVTYEQALKMIVCALNYGGQAESIQASMPGQPWYYGYLQTARTLGLTDNVTILEGQPAKRSHIAQMVYNALDVRMLEKVEIQGGGEMYMESTQTWLADKLKVTKAHGTLLADESNTLAATGETARPGYALFTNDATAETLTISKNNISVSGYLGKDVDYFYKTDIYGTNTLVLVLGKAGSNASVKIDASNLSNITGNATSGYTVTYYESATATKEKRLTVAPNPIISINGEVRANVTAAELNIESGTLEFISNDGNAYSKINVESFKTYVVKSVNKVDKYILDMYRPTATNTLVIDDEDGSYKINMKNASGSELTVSGLAQYNVLTVREGQGNAGRTVLDITVSTKSVTGTIKEIGTDYIKINNTEYKISKYLDTYGSADVDKFTVGDSCKAYLDSDGNIAYMLKVASTSTYYGYVGAAGKTSDDTVRLALISKKTTTMGSPFIMLANKVEIDGESYSDPDVILSILANAATVSGTNVDGNGTMYSQVIKYTINSSGLITEIDTVLMGQDEDPADETILSVYNKNSNTEMTYSSSELKRGDKKFRINSSTEVILVPLDRDDFDEYGRKTSSFFKTSTSYTAEAYNVTGSLNTAGVVVVYATAAIEAKLDGRSPLFMITGITQTTNADGEPCDKVTGYEISYTGTVTEDKVIYTSAPGVIAGNYTIGDIIMYTTDNKGYLKYSTDENVFRHILNVRDTFDYKTTSIAYSTTNATTVQGLLVGAELDEASKKQIFVLAETGNIAECADDTKHLTLTAPTKNFFIYDSTKEDSKKVTLESSFDLTSLACYNDTVDSGTPSASKLFVYSYGTTIRAIVIIK